MRHSLSYRNRIIDADLVFTAHVRVPTDDSFKNHMLLCSKHSSSQTCVISDEGAADDNCPTDFAKGVRMNVHVAPGRQQQRVIGHQSSQDVDSVTNTFSASVKA